jgi:60 kDa SS-A/Ro ribonucleoprotein
MLELWNAPIVRRSGGTAKRSSVELDDWGRFDRFLRGIDGGTYRAGSAPVVDRTDGVDAARRCLAADGLHFVSRIVAASHTGFLPKNDPAIFSLALAAKQGDDATRRAAYAALPTVCLTAAELMLFAHHAQSFGGWGRGMRTAVGAWFNGRPADQLAHQLVQFPAHAGFTARDLLRLSHPRAATPSHDRLYAWAVHGTLPDVADPVFAQIDAIRTLSTTTDLGTAVASIRDHRIPRACVPSHWLGEPEIWEALLPALPDTALLGELAAMTRIGLLVAGGTTTAAVAARIRDLELHPFTLLAALVGYRTGRGRQSWWLPVLEIIDALEAAFHAALDRVAATETTTLVALDVSSSMASGSLMYGVPGLTPRLASVAMAMLATHVTAFTTAGAAYGGKWGGGTPNLTPLAIGPRTHLDDVVAEVSALPMGGTDCALPMIWAQRNQIDVETFIVYTDDETWAGDVHPVRALRAYRDARGIPAKLIVVGMMSNGFRLADPDDAGMLDVVGFDASTPPVLSDFARA